MRTTTIAVSLLATVAAAVMLVGAPALAGGGGGGGGSDVCHATSEGGTLTMRDSCFDGVSHSVEAGTTLRVVNRGKAPHTVTATDGSFDSGVLKSGESFELELDSAGSVPVYCTLHGTADGLGMAGVLQVTDADGTTPALAAANSSSATPNDAVPAALIGLVVGALAHRIWSRRRRGTDHADAEHA